MNIAPLSQQFDVLVTGKLACFRRPEFVEDMISYDIMPPVAALRLLNTAYLPTGAKWELLRLRVVNPITRRWGTVDGARGQKRAALLIDVCYVITAAFHAPHVEADRAEIADAIGQCRTAYLGLQEFDAVLTLLDDAIPSALADSASTELDWMVYDNNGTGRARTRFFRPRMIGGDVDLSPDAIQPLAC